MSNLNQKLKKLLNNCCPVAVLGVGSELRGDDIAGLLVIENLKNKNVKKKLHIFNGGTAPENLTGQITKLAPRALIIIDCADAGKKPGTLLTIHPDDVAGVSFSTHMMPLSMLVQYFHNAFECEILIVGIQSKSIEFGAPVSPAVKAAVAKLTETITSLLP
jgi:hydrogenase 3 maturation protease